MGNDILGGLGNLGGLGGLVKGLSGMMPQDDPNVKLLNAQTELNDLQVKEKELFAEIGKKVFERNGGADFPQETEKLKLIQMNIAAAKQTLGQVQQERDSAEQAEQAAESAATCSSCGFRNPEGVSFCQECGTKLGAPKAAVCPSCSSENPPGTKFCGSCGARLE